MARADSTDTTIPSRLYRQQAKRSRALRDVRRLRQEAKAEIDRLIAFLDASDPYTSTELEDDDESEPDVDGEPLLGSFDRLLNQNHAWTVRAHDPHGDREHDRADWELSLGASETHPIASWPGQPNLPMRCDRTGDQSFWGMVGSDDREEDCDLEPSLGAYNPRGCTDETQAGWGHAGSSDDRERDDSESGIGDYEGLLEQTGDPGLGWMQTIKFGW